MVNSDISRLKSVKDFGSLVDYLRDVLDWPIEAEKADDITFEYRPEELGVEEEHVAKIRSIKQIRPLTDTQPWGIFYIEFEPKKLPVVVLRRILRALVISSRRLNDRMKTWDLHDLIFMSSLGEAEERRISFAHFSESEIGLPEIRTFSWDAADTYLHYLQNKMDLEKLRWPHDEEDVDAWRINWASAFRLRPREVIRTSKHLAVEMAALAKQIKTQVKTVFEFEVKNGPLHRLYKNFKQVLIRDLKVDTFADMYAQTIAYGLFSARAAHEGEFAVENISAMVPKTNPFLKNLFDECCKIGDSDKECLDLEELGVGEMIRLFKESNIEAVLADFGRQKKGEDPVIHFYEDFLKEYDPEHKVKRGIFYTPDPVVSFIVRSVDYILKNEFDCPNGLADTSTSKVKYNRKSKRGPNLIEDKKEVPKVQLLDPATGTGTFLKHVILEIKKTFDLKNNELSDDELKRKWNQYVSKHLLPRIFGFELMAAPYAVAHLKLGLLLKETGYDFKSEKRLGVYLTNTLEGTHKGAGTLDAYLNWLAEEVNKANIVKTRNISVIIGNPPYSVSSLNKSVYIENLMNDYKKDVKDERNIQPLSDDYIKFIRFAHKLIEDNSFGIIALITNNSYLSGRIHRGMRKKLLETFDKIYILNLHGSSRISEKSPQGGNDENIFDIQQGVAIAFFIKLEQPLKEKKVYYDELWGLRENKYSYLTRKDLISTKWQYLHPISPYYFFEPKDITYLDRYQQFISINNLFHIYSSGVNTMRDKFLVSIDYSILKDRIKFFENTSIKRDELKETLGIKDTRDWKIDDARRKFIFNRNFIIPYDYRPFDTRLLYYDERLIDRGCSRKSMMDNFLNRENIGLATSKTIQSKKQFTNVFITNKVNDGHFASDRSYIFPLYHYPNNKSNASNINVGRKTNINSDVYNKITEILGKKPTSEEIFYYIYTILHSPQFRKLYNELLKIDFPRIPFTSSHELFSRLTKLGKKLISLHLMKSEILDDFITTFKGGGDNKIESIGGDNYTDGRLYINKIQYFDGIPEEVYNFYIGGYQVCHKWLKDRKGRRLTNDDIEHYQKIIVAINETIRIMKEIDEVIEEYGGWPIK